MRVFGKEAGPAAALWAVAALLAAAAPAAADEGVVTVAEGSTAPKEGTKDAKAPAPAKPADPKAPAAKPAEAKPVEKAPPGPPKPGMWASMDDFMKRTGQKFEEMRFLGFRVRLTLSETLSFTDNAFYQDSDHSIVVDRTAGENSRPNDTDGPGPIVEDPDSPSDADTDNKAHPRLGGARGEVNEIVNVARLGVGLEMPINLSLLPILSNRGKPQRPSVELVKGYIESKEYLLHNDSPDALNWGFSVDAPLLLDNILGRLARISGEKSHLWFRFEGDFNNVTDPLDVQLFGFSGGAPPSFFRTGNRNDFERQEWFVKGTLGWKGPVLDALVSAKHYDFSIRNDESLDTADHSEDTGYGEVGYSLAKHRVFGFFEYTNYEFPDRSGPNGAIQSLRDFARTRTGLGVTGPVLTPKIIGTFEVFYMNSNVFNPGKFSEWPIASDPETGVGITGPLGNVKRVPFQDQNWISGSADVTYKPFKATSITGTYDRRVDWSVVAQSKMVQSSSLSFSHNFNAKLTGLLKYTVTWEDVAFREERFYQEVGAGFRYRLMTHTDLDVQYTLRLMKSRNEPVTQYADKGAELYLIRPNGDFLANIVSVGVTVSF